MPANILPRGRMLTSPGLDSHQLGSYIRKTAWGWYLPCTCCYSSEYCSSHGTVPKTVYPWTIHSALPLKLTQKDVPQFSLYFPPQTILLLHIQTSTLCFETCSTVEDVCTYFLRIPRSNEFRRFCHKPDCFSTHAVIASTSTVHLLP